MITGVFIEYLWKDPYFFFAAAFLVIFSICCHEFMHAYTALKVGDPTAADNGHLTLNPLKQMGWFSLLLFAFFGLAWGQVPVNPANLRRRGAALKVALAGPLTNLALAALLLFLCATLLKINFDNPQAVRMIFYGYTINVVLFILNMIPVPGFDGFAVAEHFFPGFMRLKSEAATIVTVVLIIILFSSISYLFAAAEFAGLTVLQLLLGDR